MLKTLNLKDVGSGAFFIAIGCFYGTLAWQSLPIGEALSMGPGYFPFMLSGLMVAIGAVSVVQGFMSAERSKFGRVPWRGVALISLSLILFALLLRPIGLPVSVFLTVLLSSRSSPETTWLQGVALGLGMAVLTAAIFIYGIGLPLPLFGTLFAG